MKCWAEVQGRAVRTPDFSLQPQEQQRVVAIADAGEQVKVCILQSKASASFSCLSPASLEKKLVVFSRETERTLWKDLQIMVSEGERCGSTWKIEVTLSNKPLLIYKLM